MGSVLKIICGFCLVLGMSFSAWAGIEGEEPRFVITIEDRDTGNLVELNSADDQFREVLLDLLEGKPNSIGQGEYRDPAIETAIRLRNYL